MLSTGARRTADRVRLACWSIESGLEVDPVTLSLGSNAALFRIDQAISARLQEILPEGTVDWSAGGPAVREDPELAIRLAQVAYDQSGGVAEGVALASALAWNGDTPGAEALLAELVGKAVDIDDRLRLALALGWVRFWGRFHTTEAVAGLLEAAEAAEATEAHEWTPMVLAEIYQELAGIALNTGHPAEALAYAERTAATEGVALSQCVAAAAAAASISYLGRCRDAISLVDEALPAAHASGRPMSVASLLFAKAGALLSAGELEQARELAEWLRDVALSGGLLNATATFGVLLGEILLRQGRPASASRIFRDSSGLLAERDLLGYRPWALSGLARARAMAGQEASASAALADASDIRRVGRHFDMSHYLAEIQLHVLAGRVSAALQTAGEAVEWARGAGMVLAEANALEAWMQIEPSAAIADRLSVVAAMTDSLLVAALAANARALVDGDAEALLEVSERFAAMSAWWASAQAAAAAARLLDRRHEDRAATAAARRAARLAGRCEGMRPPSLHGTSGPTRLTKRELEVATLAASGRSDKTIAETMRVPPDRREPPSSRLRQAGRERPGRPGRRARAGGG